MLSSVAPISNIILMDEGACENVPLFSQWIDSLPRKQYLVILQCCINPDNADIKALRRKKNVTLYFDSTDCASTPIKQVPQMLAVMHRPGLSRISLEPIIGNWSAVLTGAHTEAAIYTEDLFACTTGLAGFSTTGKTIYVQNITGSDELTGDLKSICGASDVVYLGPLSILQGGNHFMIDNHLIVGNTFVNDLPLTAPHTADSLLRAVYHLDPSVTIDFMGTSVHEELLYHLDLQLACTGPDSAGGMYKFFIAQLPLAAITPGDTTDDAIMLGLDTFAVRMASILDRYYPARYRIIRVPIFTTGSQFVLSPLNGVVDNINHRPMYYFPMVGLDSTTIITLTGYSAAQFHMMAKTQTDALRIFQAELGSDHVRCLPVPSSMSIMLGSQSLHCTMAVVGRQN
jgi:hypothetical protein